MVTTFPGWTDQTIGDASVLNVASIISEAGPYLFGLDKAKYKLLVCTEEGSGLKLNHVYLCPADPTQPLIDISDVGIHTHKDTQTGGSLFEIHKANPLFFDSGPYYMINPNIDLWGQTIGAGGALTNDTDGTTKEKSIKTATGSTNATVVSHYATGQKLDFSKRSMFQTAIKFGTASSLAFGVGINADSLSISPTNAQKINFEVCSTNNLNWWVRSADGSAPIAEDTGIAISTSKVALKFEHIPDLGTPKIDYYIGANAVWSKTTRIPVAGVPNVDNLIKFSFKNNIGADRTHFDYGCRIRYTILDTWI